MWVCTPQDKLLAKPLIAIITVSSNSAPNADYSSTVGQLVTTPGLDTPRRVRNAASSRPQRAPNGWRTL